MRKRCLSTAGKNYAVCWTPEGANTTQPPTEVQASAAGWRDHLLDHGHRPTRYVTRLLCLLPLPHPSLPVPHNVARFPKSKGGPPKRFHKFFALQS